MVWTRGRFPDSHHQLVVSLKHYLITRHLVSCGYWLGSHLASGPISLRQHHTHLFGGCKDICLICCASKDDPNVNPWPHEQPLFPIDMNFDHHSLMDWSILTWCYQTVGCKTKCQGPSSVSTQIVARHTPRSLILECICGDTLERDCSRVSGQVVASDIPDWTSLPDTVDRTWGTKYTTAKYATRHFQI